MMVLSFRDMAVKSGGAVTSAAVYDAPVTNLTPWTPIPSLRLMSWEEVRQAVQGRHVGFVIHGFNVNRDNGVTSCGAFAQELTPGGALAGVDPPIDLFAPSLDLVIPVLWPGDWYLPINYPFLLPDVRTTGRHFADFLVSSATRIARVSFVTHSMGVRVALEAIQQTLARSTPKPVFETAIFTAPAASDEVLDDPDYAAAVAAVERFVVVSSRADTVLRDAFPIGNAAEQALWPNDPGADDALGRYGPRLTPGSKALGKTEWYEMPADGPQPSGYNHGDYLPTPADLALGYPNGWSLKRVRIGGLSQAVLDGQTPAFPTAKPVSPRPPS
jgi:hypothetical protein